VRIDELVWPKDRIDHIAEHGITPNEVEEVCFVRSFVQFRNRDRSFAVSEFRATQKTHAPCAWLQFENLL
jgi:hypothetical protein